MVKANAPPSSSSPSPVLSADVAIIGAGLAGAATAYQLACRGVERIVILEKEHTTGLHSSGRNAAMIRQVTANETVSGLGRQGAEFIRKLAGELKEADQADLFREHGSLLVGSGEQVAQLEADARNARAAGIAAECWSREEAVRRFPVLRDAPFEVACHCPGDGVVDVAALLRWYIDAARAAGARILLRSGVSEIVVQGGRVRGLRTGNVGDSGNCRVESPVIINAAGGWAGAIGTLAEASTPPLRPTRRHLFVSGPLPWVSSSWPFIWNVTDEIYFRPEAGGLLLSACDVSEAGPALEPDTVEQEVLELLAEKTGRSFPVLGKITIRQGWSGIRTLTPDGRFVIGPDPKLEGFFWVAGLGGHGVTTSAAVGALAARLLLEPGKDADNPHSPSRFAPVAASPESISLRNEHTGNRDEALSC